MNVHKSKVVFGGRGFGGASKERPAIGYLPEAVPEDTASERAGFSGTCETTLSDWIQLVQMGRRDAVVKVRTHDGREGTLWCRGGDIIDAACDGLDGEDAVYRALSWHGGMVSVDFSDFSHRRQIQMATAGLLLGAAYKKDSGLQDLLHSKGLPGRLPTPVAGTSTTASGSHAAAQPRPRRPTAFLFVVAGSLLALVLVVGLVVKWVSSTRAPATAANEPVRELLLRVEADPAHAAIMLDGKQVGVGTFKASLIRDGRPHEILYSAPGYVSQLVVFRDVPPQQRVILLRGGGNASGHEPPAAEPAPQVASEPTPAPQASANVVTAPRSRRRVERSQPKRSGASASNAGTSSAALERPTESAAPRVNVRIIEERPPRVQIIGDRTPRIEVIE